MWRRAPRGTEFAARTPARASASRTRFARGIPKPFGVLIFDNRMMKRLKNFRRVFSHFRIRSEAFGFGKDGKTTSELSEQGGTRCTQGAARSQRG